MAEIKRGCLYSFCRRIIQGGDKEKRSMRTLSSNLLSLAHWHIYTSSFLTSHPRPQFSYPTSPTQSISLFLWLATFFIGPYIIMTSDAMSLDLFSTLLVVSYTCFCLPSPLHILQISSWFAGCTGLEIWSPGLESRLYHLSMCPWANTYF